MPFKFKAYLWDRQVLSSNLTKYVMKFPLGPTFWGMLGEVLIWNGNWLFKREELQATFRVLTAATLNFGLWTSHNGGHNSFGELHGTFPVWTVASLNLLYSLAGQSNWVSKQTMMMSHVTCLLSPFTIQLL